MLCGEPDFFDATKDAYRNPEAVFEVLSDSTEKFDRGDKFSRYRSVHSHKDYVLIAQDRVRIEHFIRQPNGQWLLEELEAGQVLHLPCGQIAINTLYRRVMPID